MYKSRFNDNIKEVIESVVVRRNFLEKFLDKVSEFPVWIKEILYVNLAKDVDPENKLSYVFTTYKPALTYKGKCELDYKKSNFDSNIYNILNYCDINASIS